MNLLKTVLPTDKELRTGLLKEIVKNQLAMHDLAKKVGVSKNTLDDFLDGHRSLNIKSTLKVAEFIGIDVLARIDAL